MAVNSCYYSQLTSAPAALPLQTYGTAPPDILIFLYADDVALISDTVSGLHNQLNVLRKASNNLGLTYINLILLYFRMWAFYLLVRNFSTTTRSY